MYLPCVWSIQITIHMNNPAEQSAAFDQFNRDERELYCIAAAT